VRGRSSLDVRRVRGAGVRIVVVPGIGAWSVRLPGPTRGPSPKRLCDIPGADCGWGPAARGKSVAGVAAVDGALSGSADTGLASLLMGFLRYRLEFTG
jgi:hypothetical protein